MQVLLQLGSGLIFSAIIGFLAYKRRSLSKSGVLGAIITGTLIFGFGGWPWGMVLITFFVLSSLLSKYQARTKKNLAEKFEKGSQRDLWQAMANGGMGALIAVIYILHPVPVLLAAFVGAMGTVNADTWATEIGVLSKRPPRLITTGKIVEIGTSGGVSLLGTLATLAGGLIIGISALLYIALDQVLGGPGLAMTGSTQYGQALLLPLIGALGGLAGSLTDSFLGATVQAIYYSTVRDKETEKVIDPDGTPNQHIRGWQWLSNDWVNFISSGAGALVSALIWLALTSL
ncbi:MAG: DUF92 domain-containing protein [Anaerolineae bacterium]|nr:DUF92 domain-containing protein [Anaerolineae bacterium]